MSEIWVFKVELIKVLFSINSRSSHRRCSIKQDVLKNFAITPVLKSFFNRVAGLQAWNFIKKRLRHRCFPVNIAKFLRTPILRNIYERLLLEIFIINPFHATGFFLSPSKQQETFASTFAFLIFSGDIEGGQCLKWVMEYYENTFSQFKVEKIEIATNYLRRCFSC